jgi:Bacterial PH domain
LFHRSPAARATQASQRPAGLASDPQALQAREVFRLAPAVVLWWVWLVFVLVNVGDFAIQGAPARFATVVSAILATGTGLAYALALRPRVIADQAGLTVVNPFRDHHVPWGAIQTVDTGDWVRVHYALDQDAPSVRSSADTRSISCWALYVSARTKRKAARPPRPQSRWLRRLLPEDEPGHAQHSRLPEEARYLASLPAAKAIAARLDTRARKERARADHTGPVTARWAWLPLAAVAVPALALLIAVLA